MARYKFIAGVDEVGRGPLAGAVYAAAVVLDSRVEIEGLRDSKKLSAKKREALDKEIRARSVAYSIAQASVEEIDEINILQASMLAMVRAVDKLKINVDFVYVDGIRSPVLHCRSQCVIKGDDKVYSLNASSIIAMVVSAKVLRKIDNHYPEYGLL